MVVEAEGSDRPLDLEFLQESLAEAARVSPTTKGEAVQLLASLAALLIKRCPASSTPADVEMLDTYSKLVADTSARTPLTGPSGELSVVVSALVLGLSIPSQGRSHMNGIQAVSHIVQENASSLSPATIDAIVQHLLPLCQAPIYPQSASSPAKTSLSSNRARGRSWSSGGAERSAFEDPLEAQRLALVALGSLFAKAGAQLTLDHCSQALEVLGKRLDLATAPGRLMEDLASSRLYAALLRCLQLVLVHEKVSLDTRVASLVPSLRPFFTYGLTKRPGSASTTPRRDQPWRRGSFQDTKSGSDSEGAPSARALAQTLNSLEISGDASGSNSERGRNEGAGPGPGSAATKSAYVPPHLRKTQPPLLPLPSSNGTPTKPGASFRAPDVALVLSSESEQSDSDGAGADGDRYKASKVRIEAMSCVQAVARRDPKALHSQWAALLPTHGALLTRPPIPHLLNPLLSDPLPKVRLAAAAAIGAMLEGPARAFLQAAEWKDDARSGPFLSLSATLGLIVKQLHAGLLHSVGTERSAQVLAGAFKALALLISAAPYHRLPDDLLPDTVKQVHRKTRALLANQFAAEAGGAGAAAVACLGAALGTFTPVEKVADLLVTGPPDACGATPAAPSSPSPLLADLISYCQPPTAPAIALEAFAALREALRNYGARYVGLWPALSTLLGGAFGGASAGVTDDRLVLGGVKVMDELLRSISGGDDSESVSKPQNRADLRQGPKQLARAEGGVAERGQTESDGSALLVVACATWKEVLSRHVPWLLAHQAPMVRSAALGCLAGLSRPVFESFDAQQKDFVVQSAAKASQDPIPAVRSAACRAAGVTISFPFVPDRHLLTQAILKGVSDPVVSVHILATWALANLCEALGEQEGDKGSAQRVPSETLKPLTEAALEAVRDGDKVRANAVRALGNLSAVADLSIVAGESQGDTWIDRMVAALLTCTTTGNVKVQWNVCHALAHLLGNRTVDLASAKWSPSVYSVLLLLLRTSTNFKIRIQAAAALAVPTNRKDYGMSFPDIVRCFAATLESLESDQGERPSDFKYRSNLQEQVLATLLHVLACTEPGDFSALRDPLVKRQAFLQDCISFAWASVRPPEGDEAGVSSAAEARPRDLAETPQADATWQLQKPPRHPAVDIDEQPLPPPKKGSISPKGLGSSGHGQTAVLYNRSDVELAIASLRIMYDRNDHKEVAAMYAACRIHA
ncbi:hypothetical protein KFL_000750040 [Klebsormidium nitens]|uniref:DUF4042 domain-containing protein n=1 Tax=Klebsormidium nitens TaxID=105231 RepID=A0A0U9HMX6_KLENI|nr:hypothetical protein KFL_000750040 [Klebsormidium nitens]|eukprot:GAQ81235.1 hypothetical protein KFL_000750040 [Klebsormidium nitens]